MKNFTKGNLRLIKFILEMVKEDKNIDKLHNLEWYQQNETMDRTDEILKQINKELTKD